MELSSYDCFWSLASPSYCLGRGDGLPLSAASSNDVLESIGASSQWISFGHWLQKALACDKEFWRCLPGLHLSWLWSLRLIVGTWSSGLKRSSIWDMKIVRHCRVVPMILVFHFSMPVAPAPKAASVPPAACCKCPQLPLLSQQLQLSHHLQLSICGAPCTWNTCSKHGSCYTSAWRQDLDHKAEDHFQKCRKAWQVEASSCYSVGTWIDGVPFNNAALCLAQRSSLSCYLGRSCWRF